MAVINVTNRAGKTQAITGNVGNTLMEILRDNDLDVEAICGGCCSCATCHVFVAEEYFDKLPAMKGDEDDLLDSSEHRQATSRLSCQIPISPELDGMTVTIAPED